MNAKRYMLTRFWGVSSSNAPVWLSSGSRSKSQPRMQSGVVEAQKTAYVGQATALASEYHDSDFSFDEHAAQAARIVASREEEARRLFNSKPPQSSALVNGCSVTHGTETRQPTEATLEDSSWESFYKLHGAAKFYKLRRYILLEFPQLVQAEPMHVMEIGCGCGSSMLPVLMTNPKATATVTDVSSTSIMQLRAAAQAMGIDQAAQVSSFVCDSADPAEAHRFEGLGADYLLIMFTLSALSPEQQHELLMNAFRALRPGGLVLLRDHGLYDMVQLRILPHQWLGVPNLYKRGDGTLSYFFSIEQLTQRAEAAGFVVDEARYICVNNTNRKTQTQLRRVFVHGVFRKP